MAKLLFNTSNLLTSIKVGHREVWDLDSNSDGFCTACGELAPGCCEPDARGYLCDSCGEHKVYGTSELVMMGFIQITDNDYEED